MENWRENFSMIARLKTAGNPSDALAQRLRFERLLGGANFHPAGLSPEAVVCIKKISAPPMRGGRLAEPPAEWERIVRESVEKLYRRAFRPIREAVPSSAESIVFENKSELLACLARDWRRGALSQNWWWRALFPNLWRGQTIAKIWLEAAYYAPAALLILSKSGEAARFVEKLEAAETVRLLEKIIAVFGLGKLQAAVFEPVGKGETADFEGESRPRGKSPLPLLENLPNRKISDFFSSAGMTPLETANLSFEQRVLMEIGLLLAVSPRAARGAEFAERLRIRRIVSEFQKARRSPETFEIAKKRKTRANSEAFSPETSGKRLEKIGIETARGESLKHGALEPTSNETEVKLLGGKASEPPKNVGEEAQAAGETEKTRHVSESARFRFDGAQNETKVEKNEPQGAKTEKKFVRQRSSGITPEQFSEALEAAPEVGFRTRFGGVFYLFNLGLFLGLYHDFTESLTTEIDLNIWDFTALLAREFLGERVTQDAVWEFLKLMAERDADEDFGREFDQSKDWRVPVSWLETFSERRVWRWAKSAGRLIVRHGEGFNVVDVGAGDDRPIRLGEELEIYRQCFSRIEEAAGKERAALKSKTWSENLAEFLSRRLFQALGVRSREELNALLFERPATVGWSATHLEITFGLADLPLEIRLAGIDRDPGWIPSAGKFVYFYFV